MSATVPFIPDNAPFTPEQRAWLNGMLAGMFSSTSHSAQEARLSHRVAVLYASQSGTAEGLARKLAKELKAQGHIPAVSTLVGYTPARWLRKSLPSSLPVPMAKATRPMASRPFLKGSPWNTFRAMKTSRTPCSPWAIVTMNTSANSGATSIRNSLPSALTASPIASIAMSMWKVHSRNGKRIYSPVSTSPQASGQDSQPRFPTWRAYLAAVS